MQTVIRSVLLVALFILGGVTGLCASPHGQQRLATSCWGLFDIGCGALGGLFLGGMLVLLHEEWAHGSTRGSHQAASQPTLAPPALSESSANGAP